MHLVKTNKQNIIYLLIFSSVFLLTHTLRLATDVINPDAVNWHYRTEQFVNGLKYQQWEKTYQHYHPGVTLMWITGISTEVFKQLTGIKIYDIYNFEAFDFISKFGLMFVQLVTSLYIIFILRKYFGVFGSMLLVSLFSFEPFFLGNSRLYHLDVLFSLLLFAGLITGFLAIQRNSYLYYSATGVLFALTVLTKSIGILAPAFYFAWIFTAEILLKKKTYVVKYLLVSGSAFLLSVFVFFPALWVKPVYIVSEIFNESQRVGFRRGHDQIIFGYDVTDANAFFYPLVLVVKSSPFLFLGIALFIIYWFRLKKKYQDQIHSGFLLYLLLFELLYLLLISLASKKIDRYIIPVYPVAAVLSYYGYLAIAQTANFKTLMAIFYTAFVLTPLVTYFPYYFTYTSPLFGTPVQANKVIGQKPFGVGIHDLKTHILKKYGNVKLGFIDTKPMKQIYGNSKVLDIRVNGANDYDLIILGVNEEIPQDVLNSKTKFVLSSTVEINGLDYWRIYAKQ